MAGVQGPGPGSFILILPVLLFQVALITAALHGSSDPRDVHTEVVIQTKVGRVQGLVVNSSGIVTTRFLGLPYARAPTGQLRFRPPEKHPGWAVGAPLRATEHRPACLQDSPPGGSTGDEDCLYLDIYLPLNLSNSASINTMARSVMVFIHGGDFARGSSVQHASEGWRLAAHGNVIIVGVQYRLGLMGFLSTRDSVAPGNLGLWDQRLALHWIWDNIREFGGDPDGISIFGEGAGGVSVGYHVLSPRSRGLFTRAISQGATMLSPCCLQRHPVTMAKTLGSLAQCPTTNTTLLVQCLQQVPANTLLQLSKDLADTHGGWFPVVDQDFIPDEPHLLVTQGKYNWADYIVGVASHASHAPPGLTPAHLTNGISMQEFESQVKQITRSFLEASQRGSNFQEVYASVLLEYAFCSGDAEERVQTLMDLYHQMYYVAPAILTARLLSRNDKHTYFYSFSQIEDQQASAATEELKYLFGTRRNEHRAVSDEEKRLSQAMMDAWANFAKTGNPNPVNDRGVNWRPFEEFSRHYVDFSINLDKRALRQHPWPRRTAFWNDYIPHLVQGEREWSQTCGGQELCSSLARSVQQTNTQAATAMWALAGVCVLLLFILVVIVAKCCVTNHRKEKQKEHHHIVKKKKLKTPQKQESTRHKYNGNMHNDSETRKLHPLPYCDEM